MMNRSECSVRRVAAAVALLCAALMGVGAASRASAAVDDLSLREEAAMQAAVDRVAPSIVRIETVGGLEKVGQVLIGTGPTTGVIVSPEGHVITSAFNFAQKPSSILVGLTDGTRVPAKVVATDHNRGLVLLKVDVPEKLAAPEFAPEKEILAGQWSIAAGRTFDSPRPNMSVGIVSATKRIWGKAIQTDAKVSPSNYGGPLIDIRGRVMGVLSPLSQEGGSAEAGVELYDSGIGFAVPMEHIMAVLPRLKEGKDLHPGVMGVNLKRGDMNADPAVIASCRINSPAHRVGFKADDKIVAIEGVEISRQAQVRENVAHRYAGDKIKVVVLRGSERLERELELVGKLEPYQHPFLGVLPLRVGSDGAAVAARYVYPNSPAAKAGVQAGDVLVGLDGAPLKKGRDELWERFSALMPGHKIKLDVRRGDQQRSVEVELSSLPEQLPGELPPARPSSPPPTEGRPAVGRFPLKLPEFKNDCLVYVPENYDPKVPYGVVVFFHPGGGYEDDKLIARWKAACDAHDTILLAPKALDKLKWNPNEIDFARKALDKLRGSYTIDAARVVAHGQEEGGALAYAMGTAQRDVIRAVALVDARPAASPPENDPLQRLAFYLTTAKSNSRFVKPLDLETAAKHLRTLKYPVTIKDLGKQQRPLNEAELAELLRWIDTLDRI